MLDTQSPNDHTNPLLRTIWVPLQPCRCLWNLCSQHERSSRWHAPYSALPTAPKQAPISCNVLIQNNNFMYSSSSQCACLTTPRSEEFDKPQFSVTCTFCEIFVRETYDVFRTELRRCESNARCAKCKTKHNDQCKT